MRVLLTVLALLLCTQAAAFSISLQSGEEIRWATPQISYELQQDGSDDLSDGSDLGAVRSAVKSWNNVTCSALELIEAGQGESTDTIVTTGELDGVNRLTWIEDQRWPYGSLVLGAATPIYDADGIIVEVVTSP